MGDRRSQCPGWNRRLFGSLGLGITVSHWNQRHNHLPVSVFAVNPTHHFMTLLAGIAVIAFIGVFYLHFYFIFTAFW